MAPSLELKATQTALALGLRGLAVKQGTAPGGEQP